MPPPRNRNQEPPEALLESFGDLPELVPSADACRWLSAAAFGALVPSADAFRWLSAAALGALLPVAPGAPEEP